MSRSEQTAGPLAKETAGLLAEESAVVENQMSTGILIAYLTDDNLQSVAQTIGEVTGGNVYEIGTTEEMPADYGTVFLGFSSESDELPSALDDFLERNDFGEKTVIPFVVEEGEGAVGAVDLLKGAEPESEFLDGYYMNGGDIAKPDAGGIREWLSDLGYTG